jgi:macrolide-specific efflux system membrane fusion protein
MHIWVILVLVISCSKTPIHPTKGEIVEAVYGLGTVESEKTFHAKAAIVTSVTEFYVSEGLDVVKGQKLFKNDQDAITYAPFDGRVTDIEVSIRENLFPQTQILTVIDLNKVYLSVSLEQQATMKIKPGLSAEVSFEFFRNKKLHGRISTIYPSKDQFIAKVELKEWPSGVLPGMTADVAFEIARKQNAILVPVNAISNGNILLKRNGKKLKLPVEVGLIDLEKAEIVTPSLNVEDEIILP